MKLICPKCSLEKDTSDFYVSKRSKTGFRSWCKSCGKKDNSKREPKYNEKRRLYRLNHKEEYGENKKRYYKENKELILKNNSQWRQTFKGRLLSYKRAAEKRNILWALSDSEFKSYWQEPCSYCGSEIETIGIDRLESNKGYTLKNTTSCCSQCNRMKMDCSVDDFLNKVNEIYEYQRNKR